MTCKCASLSRVPHLQVCLTCKCASLASLDGHGWSSAHHRNAEETQKKRRRKKEKGLPPRCMKKGPRWKGAPPRCTCASFFSLAYLFPVMPWSTRHVRADQQGEREGGDKSSRKPGRLALHTSRRPGSLASARIHPCCRDPAQATSPRS